MTRVRLSAKGLDLTARISELYQRNSDELSGKFVGEEQLRRANQALMSLERYWSSQISYGPAFGMIEPEVASACGWGRAHSDGGRGP